MAFRLATTTQNRACNSLVQTPDQGTTNAAGAVKIYTGTQPTNPQTSVAGTLLVTIPLNNPGFGSSASGVSALATSPAVSASVTATGTAGCFRVVDRDGNACWDGSCTATGGGGDMTWDNVSFVSGGTATINSMSITVPM